MIWFNVIYLTACDYYIMLQSVWIIYSQNCPISATWLLYQYDLIPYGLVWG